MSKNLKFVIITGLSGAGKSQAARAFEDLGYFCVDNLPPSLLPEFVNIYLQGKRTTDNIALGIDIRGGDFFDNLFESLDYFKQAGYQYEILFLDASDETLVRRYKETRRKHPLAPEGQIVDGIKKERKKLEQLKGSANKIINTSKLTPWDLKEEIANTFANSTKDMPKITVTIVSFGFKHGIPLDADLIFDVRFLPNPHYVEKLRPLTGEEKVIQDFVLQSPVTTEFTEKLFGFVEFLVPQYIKEGKVYLTIGIGCTGGRHRSVTIARKLAEHLQNSKDVRVIVDHRDITEAR